MSMQLGEAVIGQGSTGAEVKQIQQVLSGQGYNVGPIDGIYGAQTQQAVQAFQKTKGLIPDGIVGPLTWEALQGSPVRPMVLPSSKPLPPVTPSFMTSLFTPQSILFGIGGVVLFMMLRKR